jgi:glycosyltransferase involved in cell wall biosynthesis
MGNFNKGKMSSNTLSIALFSPNQNPYSETFVQAHKNYLKGNVLYYYGKGSDIRLENHSNLSSKLKINVLKVVKNLSKQSSTFVEEKLIVKSLKKHKIDVVLIEYGTHANYLLPIIKKSGLPMVVHFHGYDASVYGLISANDNYKDLFTYASKVIVVSTTMQNKLLELGCPKDKLCFNANAAQPDFLKIQPTFKSKQFVFIGRFKEKKAPYYTVLAFKQVLCKHPDATLLMVGSGVLKEVCVNLVNYFGIGNSVKFLGVISPSDFIKILENSFSLVQHSITATDGDMEGMPISVLEASSAGLPVISTYHAGISDVVLHEETGLLCKEHDVDTMSNNMLILLNDFEYAKKLGDAGKQRIKKNFSFERHIEGIQGVLEEASKKHLS